LIDRLRKGAAVIYLEGFYDPRKTVPTPAWTADSPPLGGGITTSRVSGAPRVTFSTIVLVDADIYERLKFHLSRMSLEFGREDGPGGFKFCHPDTEEGQGGQWMPMVQTDGRSRSSSPNWPVVQGIWRVVLNVGPLEAKTVEYVNGDRFDLRVANLRLVERRS
jgi:hypothetical protein